MRILFLILVIFSTNVFSKDVNSFPVEKILTPLEIHELFDKQTVISTVGLIDIVDKILTPLEIHELFDKQTVISTVGLIDIVDKIEKIESCVEEYKKNQSKSYSKIVQNNLYDLMNNFDKILLKIYGKKPQSDKISYDEKLNVLANLQCKAYYKMEVLK
jgi:hypothetical protein